MSNPEESLKNPASFMEECCYITTDAGIQTKIQLMPYQPELLRLLMDRRHTAIVKARTIGMSTLMGLYGLWRMVAEGERVTVITQRFDAGKDIARRIARTAEMLAPIFHMRVIRMSSGDVQLSNGGRLMVTTAQSFPAVLANSVGLILWDEMAYCDDMLRIGPDLMPYLTVGGQIIVYSSPSSRGKKNAFDKLLEGIPVNGFRKVKLDWRANSNLSPERAQEMRKILGDPQFARDYELIP